MTTVTAEQATLEQPERPSPADRRTGPGAFLAQIARDTWFLLLALPMGIVTFTAIVAGWSTALGSLLTFIGIPVGVVTIWATRGLSWLERRRAAIVTHERIPGLYRRELPFRSEDWGSLHGIWDWFKALLTDGQTWRDTAYGLLLLPVGIAGFTIAVTTWSVTLALLSFPTWAWIPGVDLDLGWAAVDDWSLGLKAVVVFALGEKARLHWLVQQIGEREMRAALQFAVLALVILPILPEGPFLPVVEIRPATTQVDGATASLLLNVEGVLTAVNSFDQWGVELGKEMANALLPALEGGQAPSDLDASTAAWVKRLG